MIVPTQLGFDPRLQFVHSSDATGALEAAVRNPVRGAVNVAPSGTVSLARLRNEVGYEPELDALGAVRDFAGKSGSRRIVPVPGPRSVADVLARR